MEKESTPALIKEGETPLGCGHWAVGTFTMNFRPREALFFGDNFLRFGPIGSKFSHLTFQTKRRFLSIWSVNKKSIIRVLVIAS